MIMKLCLRTYLDYEVYQLADEVFLTLPDKFCLLLPLVVVGVIPLDKRGQYFVQTPEPLVNKYGPLGFWQ